VAKSKAKTYALLAVLFTLAISIYGFLTWANQPVTTTKPSTGVEGLSTQRSFKDLSTDVFSTKVSTTYDQKSNVEDGQGVSINQIFLTSNQGTPSNPITDQLAITVGELPSEGLYGLSNVQFRMNQEGLYLQEEDPLPGKEAISFIKNDDGYEKSVFWTENGYYAAVVVSGTVDRANILNNDLDSTIASWEWQVE
jgi:hypothetical protein